MEGDRWPDLVRTGTAATVLGIPEFQHPLAHSAGRAYRGTGADPEPGY